MQVTDTILMIRPSAFDYNGETAINNYFQKKDKNSLEFKIHESALKEFEEMEIKLQSLGIQIVSIQDTIIPHTPDSIFPNNWILTVEGKAAIFPMFAENRRQERREDIINELKNKFIINEIIDYSNYELNNQFLEGTGSMVLDREKRIAYAALSERTHLDLFIQFCKDFNYIPIYFNAFHTHNFHNNHNQRVPIYHTNVMMSVSDEYILICMDSIDDKGDKNKVRDIIKDSQKELIEISEEQMNCFCGNIITLKNKQGKKYLVLSATAFQSFNDKQKEILSHYHSLIPVPIPTIEKYGGGSARCMIAEIFLKHKS